MKNYLSTGLKIVISILGLYLAIRKIELAQVWESIRHANLLYVTVVFFMILLSLLIRAQRWRVLLQGLKTYIPFGRLVELYFIGQFFNAFLPTGVGGDVVRAVQATKDAPPEIAAGTVVIDRLSGLLTLFLFALIALPFRPEEFSMSRVLLLSAVSVTGLVGGFLLLQGSILRFIGRKLEHLSRSNRWIEKFYRKVWSIFATIEACGNRAIRNALLISIGFNLLMITWWFILGRALNIDLPFFYYFLIVPVLTLALLVPSIGGAGVREAVATTLLVPLGIAPELAVALSALEFFLQRLTSLMGGGVYLYSLLKKEKTDT